MALGLRLSIKGLRVGCWGFGFSPLESFSFSFNREPGVQGLESGFLWR